MTEELKASKREIWYKMSGKKWQKTYILQKIVNLFEEIQRSCSRVVS